MTTRAARPTLFVDTNVLVFANIASAPFHHQARQTLQAQIKAGTQIWISRQVIREYLATLTRQQSFTAPVLIARLNAEVAIFQDDFQVVEDNAQVTAMLLSLLANTPTSGRQVHDANIVATMLV